MKKRKKKNDIFLSFKMTNGKSIFFLSPYSYNTTCDVDYKLSFCVYTRLSSCFLSDAQLEQTQPEKWEKNKNFHELLAIFLSSFRFVFFSSDKLIKRCDSRRLSDIAHPTILHNIQVLCDFFLSIFFSILDSFSLLRIFI